MISNDPGKPKTGAAWARFNDISRELVDCGFWGRREPFRAAKERVVIECPTIYKRSQSRPNDICTLSRRAGMIAHALCGFNEEPEWILPVSWKGNLPPDIMCERVLESLSARELDVFKAAASLVGESYRHNLLDAIGIGFHDLKRAPFYGQVATPRAS